MTRRHCRQTGGPLDFHRRVAKGYRDLARRHSDDHVLVDACGTPDEVAERIWDNVKRVIG